ncbi:hypothetical protein A2276_04240 [candidate division WOR-1 bacterium RIFOXYA12_FULL_43_27]|uniref:Flagellar hook-basal body complex protein FliE n=1 Tax=candidate division WOR-1 bacterium RIFOXYC2_FULL_46_14 TaxID=1802587 RepID=A0A1F4U370_UNCSA|nr:MAG: hypothetical protein A2276_04240 [candidate division WOR-1 bacterium RIFOXYA12_FULL_43_27]OGC19100.1 MAG: hypothetical protein A2292_00095 [candidate division WOR-1 bacterium RIFOXYB2_FULL_46_45]OGC30088.1 MAG: hypothetical protein A2232_00095 [candidate division WOR-1 bacterium RIFOXYA2_FULL_46_56]OGC39329.1 MAG: hypothetical protein A2438_00095 [candidate division WOR-1 bacterium RIFOXYC2_FULL_46_14]
MPESIAPVYMRLAQLLGDEGAKPVSSAAIGTSPLEFQKSPFEDMLSKAIDSLDGVSKQEIRSNELIESYLKGDAELSDVMVETSKLSVMVQLAVTTINTAVTTFKEITQMQV